MRVDPYLNHKARRMMSAAMYRKLRRIAAGWEREERLKARAAGVALCLLGVVVGVTTATWALFPVWTGIVLTGGLLLWLAILAALTLEFLWLHGRRRRDG